MSICLGSLRAALLAVALLMTISPVRAEDQDIRQQRLAFPKDQNALVVEGQITGYEISDYVIAASAGQVMSVDMQTTNSGAYFNILTTGSDEALYIGSLNENIADLSLPGTGDYLIRVYLVRAAARRDETAVYNLAIGMGVGEFADGLTGGPDYWLVRGVGGGQSLNVRSGPRIAYPAVGIVRNGDILRNHGCRLSVGERWCRIRVHGVGQRGWVAGRFLVETAAPAQPDMTGAPNGNGVPFDATGSLPCAWASGQPAGPCRFGVVRDGPGNAGVWIVIGDGAERQILFEGGAPVTSDSAAALSFDKESDLFLIRVGNERYEIPGAVVNGG